MTLGPGVQRDGALWIGAALSAEDREAAAAGVVSAEGFRLQLLEIDPDAYRAYYDVVANGTLWFCLHGLWDLPRRPRFDRRWRQAWATYRSVNERFAAVTAEAAGPGATVLIHDYQLALVGGMLARLRPDLRTLAFCHTPFGHPGELAVLPDDAALELLTGLAGAGACGFHARRWADNFERCCEEWLGWAPPTVVSPATTDVDDLTRAATSDACDAALADLDRLVGDRQLIVRVDRIELSKNVLRGFWAFDELLTARPDLRGRVVFGAFVYPSRQGLADYLAYGQEIQTVVGMLNQKWGTAEWTPILLDPDDHYPRSVAALRRADVLLVNPIRDGLNLVAMEGPLVNERDGSLVLSRQAGCWDELGAHAFGVNPFDVEATAAALGAALDLPADVRAARARALRAAA
ncbi:MAG: alpha,alpha-trehalose-phosphate synthase (UDP-forming), partial [Actinomycetes bacterium]